MMKKKSSSKSNSYNTYAKISSSFLAMQATLQSNTSVASAQNATLTTDLSNNSNNGLIISNQFAGTLTPYVSPENSIFQTNSLIENEHDENIFSGHITHDYIKHLIQGSEQEKEFYADVLMRTRDSSEITKTYVDFVLQCNPQFKMIVSPTQPARNPATYFMPFYLVRLAPNINDIDPKEAAKIMAHEFRHACFQLIHTLLSQQRTLVIEPFYPVTEQNILQYQKNLENGDNFILLGLPSLLLREKDEQINQFEAIVLNQIRAEMKASLQDMNFEISFTEDKIKQLTDQGIDFFSKDIIHFGSLVQPALGDIKIKEIVEKSSISKIKLEFIDPVNAFICNLYKYINHVKDPNNYLESEYNRERDAYLYERMPPKLIALFYSNIFGPHQILLEQARIAAQNFSLQHLTENEEHLTKNYQIAIHDALTTYPNIIRNYNYDIVFKCGLKWIAEKEPTKAENAFIFLISKGFNAVESNIQLGNIHYEKRQFGNACQHFKKAIKNGGILSAVEHFNYGHALLLTKRFKEASKILRDADKNTSPELQQQIEELHDTAVARMKTKG